VVLVAKDSQVIFEHSYDPRKIGQKYSEEDINRQFPLGSMTKQFTAALILKLVDRQVISLEDSIQKYFPDTPRSWANIKIRNLLNHTSGFTYEYLTYRHGCPFRSEDQALSKLKRINPSYTTPGENFNYVNMNYFLLGKIVERVYGKDIKSVVQSEITDPLSMNLTGVLDQNACHFGVGNMYSAPRDLLKWENALFNDKTVLSEATFKEMISPDVSTYHYYQTLEGLGKKKTVVQVPDSYGLGIRIQEVDGEIIYWHSGHVLYNTALFEYYPRRKETIVVLANKKNEKVFDIARDAINAVFDLPTVPQPYQSKLMRASSKHKGAKIGTKTKLTASNRLPSPFSP
jgi:CubicO group peptidase (beta-lactamase class C family)